MSSLKSLSLAAFAFCLVGCGQALPPASPQKSASASSEAGAFLNHQKPIFGPVTEKVFADPSVMKVDDTYYAYATQGRPFGDVYAVPMATSKDFKTWEVLKQDAMPKLPDWAEKGKHQSFWAPDVFQSPTGTYLMYFTATVKNSNKHHCLGVAKASKPTGPFEPQGDGPIVCPDKNSVIDPSGWIGKRDPSKAGSEDEHFLLYKTQFTNPSGNGYSHSTISVQPMSSDGLKPQGEPWVITKSTPAELNDNEAPSLVYAGGSFVLFFSTGSFSSPSYTVSVATSPTLDQMFKKRGEPLLKTGSGKQWGFKDQNPVAPGGADVMWREDIKDLEGGGQSLRMVFHAAQGVNDLLSRHLWVGAVKVKGGEVSML